jgi:imidazole glycerol-phosphate synthase subunit HisH
MVGGARWSRYEKAGYAARFIDHWSEYHASDPGIKGPFRRAKRQYTSPRGKPCGVRIAVCDVGIGNLRSVERALLEACALSGNRAQVEVTHDPARLASADRLVMPGQGGFKDCAVALSAGVGDAVRTHLAAQRPYLGICLGLQVLFESSEEAPGCAGLGVLKGEVVRLGEGIDTVTGASLKIPHTGWNVAEPTENAGLLTARGEHFYFVHSFVVAPRDPSIVAATTEYGARFVSAVAYGNVFACQFHPEKSQRAGLALLERFLAS